MSRKVGVLIGTFVDVPSPGELRIVKDRVVGVHNLTSNNTGIINHTGFRKMKG